MDLLEFAKIVRNGGGVSEQEFVDLMRRVVPLDELRNLTPEEAEWFCSAATWLYDLSILAFEFAQAEHGKRPEVSGVPSLPGPSGPFISNILTREPGEPADFSLLKTFGVGPEDNS